MSSQEPEWKKKVLFKTGSVKKRLEKFGQEPLYKPIEGDTYYNDLIELLNKITFMGIAPCQLDIDEEKDTMIKGFDEQMLASGTDQKKMVVIGVLNGKKIVVKIFFKDGGITELGELNVQKQLKQNPNNYFHCDLFIKEGSCILDIETSKKLGELFKKHCSEKNKRIGPCMSNTINSFLTGNIKNLMYTISRFAEYSDFEYVVYGDDKKNIPPPLKLVRYDYPTSKGLVPKGLNWDENFSNIGFNQDLFAVILQIFWQFVQFAKQGFIHGDPILENFMFFTNLDFSRDKKEYFEYDISGKKFYIIVKPYLVKFIDFGKTRQQLDKTYSERVIYNLNLFFRGMLNVAKAKEVNDRIVPRFREKLEQLVNSITGKPDNIVDDKLIEFIYTQIDDTSAFGKTYLKDRPIDVAVVAPVDSKEYTIVSGGLVEKLEESGTRISQEAGGDMRNFHRTRPGKSIDYKKKYSKYKTKYLLLKK